jgi:uncharacterized protein involved in outer membrane biogenesis
MANLRLRRWHYIVGVLLIASVVLIAVWNWDWFIPPLTRMTAAKLGRPVQIEHLHLRIARNPVLEADGVVIGNPSGFPAPGPFARIERLGVMVNGPAWLHSQAVLVPSIEMENPVVDAIALPDGRNNWTFPFNATPPGTRPGSGARIGNLRITGGHIHVVDPKLRADFHLDIATREAAEGHPAQLVIEATGQYAGQPITGRFVGGALLTLRDRTNPYPIDLRLANGTTHVALQGTVQDPLVFAGTNLKVEFSGESLANLMPLTGVPAPGTPPFRLTGEVNYVEQRLRLENLVGQLGSSDIEGNITVDPGTERPRVTVELHSRRVDLADLGGFIGTTPGRVTTPGQTPAKRREVARAEAGPYLIPHTPLALSRLKTADVTARYRGDRIEGRSIPLDNVVADLKVENGVLRLRPLSFGVGNGRISGDITAGEAGPHALHARADVDFRQVDVAHLLATTHTFGGSGTIGGHATVEGTGGSLAGILGEGNGELKLFMTGGDLSALLVDLSGLEFGNALFSALGLPKKTEVRCLVADFALRQGIMNTRTLLLDTGEANITGKGSINLRVETIDYQLKAEAKHFSIGSLPAPIDITGRLKNPNIGPDAKDLAVRGGIAAGLGALLSPLAALLPTIQLGLGKDNNCDALIRSAQRTPNPAEKRGEAP